MTQVKNQVTVEKVMNNLLNTVLSYASFGRTCTLNGQEWDHTVMDDLMVARKKISSLRIEHLSTGEKHV